MSSNDDRATLHQLLITGTAHDSDCTPCPTGMCGSGGAMGCNVCAKGTSNPSAGALECQAYMTKEPCIHDKRALYTLQKSPVYMTKEPFIHDKRALYA